ncbi:hydroxyphenylacetyl-CoA thioesterase PaaI [Sporichthya sp.]|uniref:hydroxyphenylacetyl-CoA thioesterase PaaI n=1 Tax=Sporichthya sp. TaxID=65475 RepID=UPI0017C7C0D4|nr:hydroxyphenylacetyl-CoA thioesterase PaaI [Sporichthya sp.]
MMRGDRASGAAGISLVDAAPGEVTVTMTVTKEHVNGFDICHGGVLFTLADTAFALACNSHGPMTVAAGADITFCKAAAPGDVLTARAVERTRFGRSGIYDVTVTRGTSDGGAEIVAEFRGRSRTIGETQPGAAANPIDPGGSRSG